MIYNGNPKIEYEPLDLTPDDDRPTLVDPAQCAQVWAWCDAPAAYQALSSTGDEQWVALVPRGYGYAQWLDYLGNTVHEHVVEYGVVYIGRGAA